MKIELRKIELTSLLFSAFPIAVFCIMLIKSTIVSVAEAESFYFSLLGTIIFAAIVETFAWIVVAIVTVAVYNFICALGLRGVRLELDDVE